MKLIIVLCAALLGSVIWIRPSETKPVCFEMNNRDWFFPSTAGEAVTKHQLDYKAPGYYYKEYPDGSDLILYYHYADGDFDNQSQSKEVLFPRKLHSYMFRFANKPGVLDSLLQNLETAYHKKIVLKCQQDDEIVQTSIKSRETSFEWGLLTVHDGLTIGIAKGEKKVVVRYMYDLPLDMMEVYMKRFTE
ncbi:MAG: hypothetical protein ABIN80_03690 [Dyadobacter sp.]|uniref:hypothetical protein n=1 Tax=Dyadobacter sp. TaxID=1914288 RepID=UPI003262ECBE